MLLQCPEGKAGGYTIPSGVTSIGGLAFYDCASLTNVIIGNSVTSIGSYAFEDCVALTSLTISNSVTNILEAAFRRCSSLTSVTIPSSVTSIGDDAFRDCTSLTAITIPASVANLGYWAFGHCPSLTAAYFKGNVPNYVSSPSTGGAPFYGATNATVFYLPGTIGWEELWKPLGCPTAPWVLPYPVILTTAPNFGIQTNALGFRISWATNASVVVEASTNLANQMWIPVSTNTLTDGWTYFSDAEWTNYPARFYRVRQW